MAFDPSTAQPVGTDQSAPSSGFDPSTAVPVGQTKFQESTDSTNQPELTWGETAEGAAKNFIPSVVGAAKAAGHAIVNPKETLGALGQIGKGAVSQAAGAMGVEQDPKEKANTEQLLNALEDHYKTGYGSVKGFKQMVATDPASVLMDASTVLAPGAGLAGKAGMVGKIGEAASVISKATDPINLALQAAKGTGSLAMKGVRGLQATTTGVPSHMLKVISGATSADAPVGALDAFHHYSRGAGTPAELQTDALKSLASVKDDVSSRYLSGKADLSTASVPLTPMLDKADDLDQMLKTGATSGIANAHGKAALQEIKGYLNDIAYDPTRQTLPEMDAVKQQIWDLHNTYTNDKAPKVIDGMYHSVRDTMGKVDPNYVKLMEQYQGDARNIDDLVKTLGLGKKSAATSTAIKMMRANKINTIAGAGRPLIDQLADHDPLLPYKLAGIAVKNWAPGGLRNVAEGVGPLAAILHPASALPVIGGMAAMSPKLAGIANRATGRLGETIPALSNPLVTKPTYYAGRVGQQSQPTADDEETPITEKAMQYLPDDLQHFVRGLKQKITEDDGDRVGRASGGKVDVHSLVDRLVNRWKSAKRATNESTKPLLQMHDDAVAKALEVAGDAL